ncbi:hypothetical protein C8J35_10466 [Rhizobium sp. PP-F2F-G38]|nr:hypothetical protein C8J37_105288 [Rhizobium sp. PP-WC-1G-195]PYE98091.1 hypothetical protein C8J35_10466 [Rhizobium sp. PP-F2F-G38]
MVELTKIDDIGVHHQRVVRGPEKGNRCGADFRACMLSLDFPSAAFTFP